MVMSPERQCRGAPDSTHSFFLPICLPDLLVGGLRRALIGDTLRRSVVDALLAVVPWRGGRALGRANPSAGQRTPPST